jgi:para-aminobenzoate synthetase component 1
VVPELCALEEFAQVFHLTSTVEGMLAPERDALDLFEASFPGGSITGAPKLRAMEILETLEPVRRHVYTGAIGYLDWSGDADWSIAIRTALLHGDAVHWNAGGGITADSDPESEHQETLDKGLGMRLALEDLMGPIELAAVTSEVAR